MADLPPLCDFGWIAPDFTLPATDSAVYSLADIAGENGTLIMFICNHCPYVLAVLDRIIQTADELQELGIGVAAISSNDVAAYPQDSIENMTKLANQRAFSFPYLYDETQDVARNYDAVCTPDFFGFDRNGGLQYRGRLNASGKDAASHPLRRDLFDAMKQVAETQVGPTIQTPSMGCSIKWK